jgi:hypothetical protein
MASGSSSAHRKMPDNGNRQFVTIQAVETPISAVPAPTPTARMSVLAM